MAIANRIFDDLQPLMQENSAIDPGYIGKPWGGMAQKSTTMDQTFFFNMGLYLYARITDAERANRARGSRYSERIRIVRASAPPRNWRFL